MNRHGVIGEETGIRLSSDNQDETVGGGCDLRSRGSGTGSILSFGVGPSVIVEKGPATSVHSPTRRSADGGPARQRWPSEAVHEAPEGRACRGDGGSEGRVQQGDGVQARGGPSPAASLRGWAACLRLAKRGPTPGSPACGAPGGRSLGNVTRRSMGCPQAIRTEPDRSHPRPRSPPDIRDAKTGHQSGHSGASKSHGERRRPGWGMLANENQGGSRLRYTRDRTEFREGFAKPPPRSKEGT